METQRRWSFLSESSLEADRHRTEAERTLRAIAMAIAAGLLPPDDAFAWARIASSEARRLEAVETDRRAA